MENKTAVEWLWEEIDNAIPYQNIKTSQIFNKLFEQAKKLEKQQIIDAFWEGDNTDCISEQNIKEFAEQYYNETFKI
jgi:hypothetical protein